MRSLVLVAWISLLLALVFAYPQDSFSATQADTQNQYGLPDAPFRALLITAKRIVSGHFMSAPAVPSSACAGFEINGYQGLPTKRCRYSQGKLRAEVVLLDADATQLARWVLFICQGFDLSGEGSDNKFLVACGRKVLKNIQRSSSGHFPVAGIVTHNGRAYAYRDGVVVVVPGLKNGSNAQLSSQQIESAISGPVIRWGKYAMLQGSTYSDYVRFGRLTDAKGQLVDESALTYPQLVAERFRTEWGGNFNSLMRAWACANISGLGISASCLEIPASAPGAARDSP